MSVILAIDTSTDVCSVSLLSQNEVIIEKVSNTIMQHAILLATFVDELLKESESRNLSLSAIAVCEGPGSYTGLRIGVSLAKGLCYGMDLPLISVNTLQSLFNIFSEKSHKEFDYYIPMIDARRMEIYTAVYDKEGLLSEDISAKIINTESFSEYSKRGKIALFGNGAEKCSKILKNGNFTYFEDINNLSSGMRKTIFSKLETKNFEDVAYFEPFYLKDFITTQSKKNLIEEAIKNAQKNKAP